MSGVQDLKQQLERLGGEPVPPARPEFRAELLAKILETKRETAPSGATGLRVVAGPDGGERVAMVPAPRPVRPDDELQRRRRTRVLAQAAAAVSIAAAAAGVLGVVSLVDNGQAPVGVAGAGTEAELASGESLTHVVIKPSGELEAEGGGPAEMDDGVATMTCEETTGSTMVFYDTSERGYYCPPDEVVRVQVDDNAIVSVIGAPSAPARHIKLLLDEPQYVDGSADPLTWSWERYSGRRFDRYELRRYAEGTDPEAAEVVATIDDVKQTTFREAALPAATSIYYVAVIAPDGSESGRSGEFKVSISVERS